MGTAGSQAACWWVRHQGVSKEPLPLCMSPHVSVGVAREALGSGSVPSQRRTRSMARKQGGGVGRYRAAQWGHQVSSCSHRALLGPAGPQWGGGDSDPHRRFGRQPSPWQLVVSLIPGPLHLVCPVLECLHLASHQNRQLLDEGSPLPFTEGPPSTMGAQQILVGSCLAQSLPWPECRGHSGTRASIKETRPEGPGTEDRLDVSAGVSPIQAPVPLHSPVGQVTGTPPPDARFGHSHGCQGLCSAGGGCAGRASSAPALGHWPSSADALGPSPFTCNLPG